MSILWPLLVAFVFLLMISVLVAAHELGHYLFARLFGMGVEEFAIGMGKRVKLLGRKTYELPVSENYVHKADVLSQGFALEGGAIERDSELIDTGAGKRLRETTDFTVRALPIGGFVRIKGMIPQDDGSEVNIPGGFYSKPPLARLVVLIAGPLFSVIAGIVLLFGVYWTKGVYRFDNAPVIASVIKSSAEEKQPAWEAGLRPGDRILEIQNRPISTFYEFVAAIQANPEVDLPVRYEREGKVVSTILRPAKDDVMEWLPGMRQGGGLHEAGKAGISPGRVHVPLSAGEAFAEAAATPQMAVNGVIRIVTQPSRLRKEAGGAVTMVRATNEATKQGLDAIVALAALISISVGIFNLLPIPPLDGGQMLMAFAELLRGGKRLSVKVQQTLLGAGFAAVILLTAFVLFVDFSRLADSRGRTAPTVVERETK